ncbi:hypothetical protein HRI_001516900 [Hibiscus trionum]|uniref:Uncharacterized protein n=1 Tax=Hibiscus trionum TaxID=183268 RepID=A0A9W7HJU3_HIBTR|nr:hypothetical protein HRI_001516900 [Hibiscus trionum]
MRDVAVVFGLAAAIYVNNWIVLPLYLAAQWTIYWALFILSYDCGHVSFSNNPKLNSVVGASLAFFNPCALSWMVCQVFHQECSPRR